MKFNKKYTLLIISFGLTFINYSQTTPNTPQGVSIAPTQTPPSKNAMLDVVASEKGILIPRVLFSVINDPLGTLYKDNVKDNSEDGLLVFVTDAGINYGYWYFDDIDDVWKRLGGSNFNIEQMTWNEMHNSLRTVADLGDLVYVTDCEYTCGGVTRNVRGLYYYSGIGYNGSRLVDSSGFCITIPQWVRVIDGRILSECLAQGASTFLCLVPTSGVNNCLDGVIGEINSPSFNPTYSNVDFNSLASLSDSTYKQNVVVISNAIDKIKLVNGVYYNWIPNQFSSEIQMGVVAQNIQSVFPEAVEYVEGGKLGVKYELLVAPLIEATKEQQVIIESQQATITTLQSQIQDLINRVTILEQQ